jgi:hypothetical protein
MARMIDPSTLEGGELFDWYNRSPADVEAEREAARQAKYDAFVKSIGSASASGDATAGPTNSTDGSDDAPSGTEPGVIQARYYRPIAPVVMGPPVMEAPSGPRVGPSVDARGGPPSGGARSGFFGSHDYSDTLGGYYTDLPKPLNFVTSHTPGWWQLGDGTLAQQDEVERIYAEQQRRLKGQEDAEPALRVHTVDNLPAGQIPRVEQVPKGERELDPTCSPYGGWERDPGFPRYSQRTKLYETQITRAPGLDYVVRIPGEKPVKFDGCAVWDPRHPLLEAKGPGYADLLPKAAQWHFLKSMGDKAKGQAARQADAARDHRVEWHIAEPGALPFFRDETMDSQPPIAPQLTPPRW